MTKKTAKPRAHEQEAKTTEPEPTPHAQEYASNVVIGGLPRFNFNAPPTAQEVPVTDTPVRPSYESIQQEAKGGLALRSGSAQISSEETSPTSTTLCGRIRATPKSTSQRERGPNTKRSGLRWGSSRLKPKRRC
jgi:hypothetical protein